MVAAAAGLFSIVQYMLESGANINAQDSAGMTPLMKACSLVIDAESLLETIRLLLERGASVTLVNHSGETALEIACYLTRTHHHKYSIIQLLLSNGSTPYKTSNLSESLLCPLFLQHDFECCEILQRHGATAPSASDMRLMTNKAVQDDNASGLKYASQLGAPPKC
ncbi:ankyrin repeat-containing domain protein [Whalleya microplaca]|nr:ankyrin repeat-containing domain protein [Whalleya microplaca]